jgi:hypothetical protein
MKYILLIVGLIYLSFGAFAQTSIFCVSGQVIKLDGAKNFISSNFDSLVIKYTTSSESEKTLFPMLLNAEKNNKLSVVALDKSITILNYDLKKAEKSEQIKLKATLNKLNKEKKSLEKEYEIIAKELVILLKHDKKKLASLEKKYNVILPSVSSEITPINTQDTLVIKKDDYADDAVLPIKEEKNQLSKDSTKIVEKQKVKKKSSLSKEPNDCSIVFNGKDSETNKKRLVLQNEKLLTYTPDKMKSYYKFRDFLTANCGLEKYDGKNYLNLEVVFNSKDVMKSYGTVHRTDFLRLEFLSGKKVFLKAIEIKDPFVESHTANTIFKVRYLFENSSDIETLENDYLDKLGIMWSSGFESYPINDVDFFNRQMKCLKSAK